MDGMQRRNMYFPEVIWQRLVTLAEREGVAIADVLRRLLGEALGITDEIMAQVELEDAGGDPLPKLRRDLVHERLERSKLSNALSRLELDMQQHIDRTEDLLRQTGQGQLVLYRDLKALQAAEEPRRVGWQQLTESMTTLYDRLEAHVDTTQRVMQATTTTLTAQNDALQNVRAECGALRGGIEQLAALCIDLLRRVRSVEQGGPPDIDAQGAIARGESWLNQLEATILAAQTGTTERQGAHE